MVRIIVLGSSAATPLPRTVENRFDDYRDIEKYQKKFSLHTDELCASAADGGRDRRTRSSLAVVIGAKNKAVKTIIFDAGPDIHFQLKRENLEPNAICITHAHMDACMRRHEFGIDKVFCEADGTLRPGREFEIFGTRIMPFRVRHSHTAPCVGFVCDLRAFGGGRIVYMTDVSSLAGTRKFLSVSDVLFADGSILGKSILNKLGDGHLSIQQQLKQYKKWKLKKVYFTHIGHRTARHEELARLVKACYKNSDVAYDGMVIKF